MRSWLFGSLVIVCRESGTIPKNFFQKRIRQKVFFFTEDPISGKMRHKEQESQSFASLDEAERFLSTFDDYLAATGYGVFLLIWLHYAIPTFQLVQNTL